MAELGLHGLVGLLLLLVAVVRWKQRGLSGKGLPAGAIGWPLIGETIDFLLQGHDFTKIRKIRYGNLFKSHVLGCPLVVSMDPDVNRNILTREGQGLVMAYPRALRDLLGKYSIGFLQGALHKSVRGTVLSLIGPQAIREALLPKLDSIVQSYLCGLGGGQIVDIQEMTKKMSNLIPLKLFAGIKRGQARDILIQEFSILVSGAFSLPFNLPGFNFHRALQARKTIGRIFEDILSERRRSSSGDSDDMLYSLLHVDQKTDRQLTDEQIIDLIIALVFAGHDTVATTLMMALKYLHDHPRVLEEIREEHLEIKKRKSADETVKWEYYKSMNLTRSVILETMRMASIVSGTLRNTTEDVEINGISVPAGWKIYICMREHHYDPTHYPEPFQFNPWRWQDKSLETHNRFMMFGGGNRLCPGKELAMVLMSIFLHHFLTRYRWEAIGEQKIKNFPRIEAPKGLPYRIWEI